MKKFLQLLIFLCVATATYAQSNMEAKMAYQMAEEKFDAKQYDEALNYLEKAGTALGSTNPPMLFLKIMIANQIVTAKESVDNYKKLEKAIADFEKLKNKNALGEDKLMEVYRIKMDLDKRKTAYEKEADRTAGLQKQYGEMIRRLAAEFPKTETNVSNFLASIPSTWADQKMTEKQRNKQINYIIKSGGVDYYGYSIYPSDGQFYLMRVKTYGTSEDRVEHYYVQKRIKYVRARNNFTRNLTIEELCGFLNITTELWNDFTLESKPLILKDINQDGYWIFAEISEKGPDGKNKQFQMFISAKTVIRDKIWEEMRIIIFRNTI